MVISIPRHRSRPRAVLKPAVLGQAGFPVAVLIASGLAVMLGPLQPARAHAIESSLVRLQSLSDTLELRSLFSGGMPVDGAEVRLVSADGQHRIAVGRTDRLGSLRFRLPDRTGRDWELQVDGGAGHRDYLELPSVAPATPSQALQGPAAQLQPSRDQSGGLPLALMLVGGVSGHWFWSRRHR